MRQLVLVLTVVMAGCGSGAAGDSTDSGPGSAESENVVELTGTRAVLSALEDGGLDHEPVLVVVPVCYSLCPRTRAVPKFALYPDGTLVAVDRETPTDSDSDYRMRSFPLGSEDLDVLAGLIDDGGLVTGDIHAAGTRDGVADGGGIVFETLIGSTRTYVHAPLLSPSDPDSTEGSGSRQALNALVGVLSSHTQISQGTELPVGWVMVGEAHRPEPSSIAWEGVGTPNEQPPCVAFDPAELQPNLAGLTSQEDYEAAWILFDGDTYAMTARPLLPHQNGCSDVQDALTRMLVNDESLQLGGEG